MSPEMREALEAIAKGSFPGASNAVLDGTFSAKLQEIARKALSTPPRLDPHTIMACLKEVEVGTPHMIKREVAERIRSLLHSSEQLGDTAATGAECNYYRGPDPKDLPDQFTINMIDIGE